jgi:hypothetical protein
MNVAFKQFGIFEEFLSVGEMTVKYYGLHSRERFIRGKPTKSVYKLRAVCGRCFNLGVCC